MKKYISPEAVAIEMNLRDSMMLGVSNGTEADLDAPVEANDKLWNGGGSIWASMEDDNDDK